MSTIALGKTLLGVILILSITGITSIIVSFFYDKTPQTVSKKSDTRYKRKVKQNDDEITLLIKDWESPMSDGDNV